MTGEERREGRQFHLDNLRRLVFLGDRGATPTGGAAETLVTSTDIPRVHMTDNRPQQVVARPQLPVDTLFVTRKETLR